MRQTVIPRTRRCETPRSHRVDRHGRGARLRTRHQTHARRTSRRAERYRRRSPLPAHPREASPEPEPPSLPARSRSGTRDAAAGELALSVSPDVLKEQIAEGDRTNASPLRPLDELPHPQLVLFIRAIGQDLLVWTQRLLLADTALARCEPKRLRYRLLHVAGRLTRHARRLVLHLPRRWPWRQELLTAFHRLRALPQPP